VVENCLFDGNTSGSVGGLFLLGAGPTSVRNNMVMENAGGGLMVSGTEAVENWNNIWNNTGGDNLSVSAGSHSFSLDPLFVNAAAGDFGLGQYSPNVDGGAEDAACLDPDGSCADIGLKGGPAAAFVSPAAVAGAALADLGGGDVRVTWQAAADPTISHYVVYRDTAAIFRPSAAKVVFSVPHPGTTFDDTPPAGDWYYLVAAIDSDGYSGGYSDRVFASGGGVSAVGDSDLPRSMAITGIAPNPFNPQTTISYDLPRDGQVQMSVYDVRGRHVRVLVDGVVNAGRHSVNWDGRDQGGRSAAAGVYFVRMIGPAGILTSKMVLAK
jgi:hypothetical protein